MDFYGEGYYVVDDDSGAILTGPLSEQSAEDFVDSCIQDWKEDYVDKDELEMVSLYE